MHTYSQIHPHLPHAHVPWQWTESTKIDQCHVEVQEQLSDPGDGEKLPGTDTQLKILRRQALQHSFHVILMLRMDPSAPMDPIARNTAKGGMTMQQLSHILRLAYYATPFGDPHQEPFNYTGYDAAFADMVGFASLMQGGTWWNHVELWNMHCSGLQWTSSPG